MAQYRYTGPGPIEIWVRDGGDLELVLIHPGDEREFAEEPAIGPWEAVEAEGSEKPSEATPSTAPTQPPASKAENPPSGQPEPSSPREA